MTKEEAILCMKDMQDGMPSDKCGDWVEALNMAIVALKQPERKRGKWITTRTWAHDGEIYCDQCESDAPTEGDYRQVKTNFCPNCGADMRGDKHG